MEFDWNIFVDFHMVVVGSSRSDENCNQTTVNSEHLDISFLLEKLFKELKSINRDEMMKNETNV